MWGTDSSFLRGSGKTLAYLLPAIAQIEAFCSPRAQGSRFTDDVVGHGGCSNSGYPGHAGVVRMNKRARRCYDRLPHRSVTN